MSRVESTSYNLYSQDTLRRLLRESGAAARERAEDYVVKVRLGLQVPRFPDNKEFSLLAEKPDLQSVAAVR